MTPEDRLDEIANAVDRLSGQVAALTAFVVASSAPLLERELAWAVETARKLAPTARVGPGAGARAGSSPRRHARKRLAAIQKAVSER